MHEGFMQLYSGEFEKPLVAQIQLQDQKERALTAMKAVSALHRFGASVICRIKFRASIKINCMRLFFQNQINDEAARSITSTNFSIEPGASSFRP
jgi:hypothetical protein